LSSWHPYTSLTSHSHLGTSSGYLQNRHRSHLAHLKSSRTNCESDHPGKLCSSNGDVVLMTVVIQRSACSQKPNSDITTKMCYYEKITFVACGHEEKRLIQHCHFARNDPGHQCFGAWRYKREWNQYSSKCGGCTEVERYTLANRSSQDGQSPHSTASER
jgi:hypothetical protein